MDKFPILLVFLSLHVTVNSINVTNYRWRLNYHIMAESGWINDPNGLIYYKDEYHVFFQHNPEKSTVGLISWGHVKSSDLVHWEYLPEALVPGDTYVNSGCFSGSAIVDGDDLVLIYTGNNDGVEGADTQCQCAARSPNGLDFKKDDNNPLIPYAPEGGTNDFRDPKVWSHDGYWYMVTGNKKDDYPRVVLYKSKDLNDWEYVGVLAEDSTGSLGYMWECPDFYELDGKYILMMSPQGIEANGDDYQNLFNTGYLIGDYNYDTNTFTHGEFHELDHGHDFYAIQSFLAPNSRRTTFAWMDMWEADFKESEDGWAGAMTIPRVLSLSDDCKIIQNPAEELLALREMLLVEPATLDVGDSDYLVSAEILLNIDLTSEASQVGLLLLVGDKLLVEVYYDKNARKIVLNRDGDYRQKSLESGDEITLQIFLDKSSIEVFVNDGVVTMTSRIYPSGVPSLNLVSRGGNTSMEVTIYGLKNVHPESTV